MSILHRLSVEQIEQNFTHIGWFCGLVPVYIAQPYSESPMLAERNWIPEWWFSMVSGLFGVAIFIATMIDDRYEPMFPIAITGEIK